MRYNTLKKQQKIGHSISPVLIAGNKFQAIVDILQQKPALTHQEKYLYGYALLRTQKEVDALVIWWPLVAKGYPTLQRDCAVLAARIFKDEQCILSAELSDEALHTLLLVAKNLVPDSQGYCALKKRFFESLWQKGDYEQLERVLKLSKGACSGILLENLSKLAFFRSDKKMVENLKLFVSRVLTGGACLILGNSLYHSDIDPALQLLGNEIKQLFYSLKVKNGHKLGWDKTVFEHFVDCELTVLIRVLQLAVKNGKTDMDIVFSPGYLMMDEMMAKRMGQGFLSWLAVADKAIFSWYDARLYQAVLDGSESLKMHTESFIPKLSVLLQKNPFEILNVAITDCKSTIMRKVLELIQRSPEQMAVFRHAQNELFNPAYRFLHHYFRFFSHENSQVDVDILAQDFSLVVAISPTEIPLRSEFLNANA